MRVKGGHRLRVREVVVDENGGRLVVAGVSWYVETFHGSTNNETLNFEKPARKDETGTAGMVPAAAHGRWRHEDVGRACIRFGAGAAGVAWRSRDKAFSDARPLRAPCRRHGGAGGGGTFPGGEERRHNTRHGGSVWRNDATMMPRLRNYTTPAASKLV